MNFLGVKESDQNHFFYFLSLAQPLAGGKVEKEARIKMAVVFMPKLVLK